MFDVRRREFVALLGGAATWPLAAGAQQLPVIGFLNGEPAALSESIVRAFQQKLRDMG